MAFEERAVWPSLPLHDDVRTIARSATGVSIVAALQLLLSMAGPMLDSSSRNSGKGKAQSGRRALKHRLVGQAEFVHGRSSTAVRGAAGRIRLRVS